MMILASIDEYSLISGTFQLYTHSVMALTLIAGENIEIQGTIFIIIPRAITLILILQCVPDVQNNTTQW